VLALPEVSGAAWVALAGVFGLLVGSFLNVVIHRLRRCSSASGASSAPNSRRARARRARARRVRAHRWRRPARLRRRKPRDAALGLPGLPGANRAWQNIPLISYLLLRGRCASCGARISLRYPLIELLCGLLTAAVAWKFGVSWPAFAAAGVTWFSDRTGRD